MRLSQRGVSYWQVIDWEKAKSAKFACFFIKFDNRRGFSVVGALRAGAEGEALTMSSGSPRGSARSFSNALMTTRTVRELDHSAEVTRISDCTSLHPFTSAQRSMGTTSISRNLRCFSPWEKGAPTGRLFSKSHFPKRLADQ